MERWRERGREGRRDGGREGGREGEMEGRREGGKVRKREEESRLIRYQGTVAGCTHQLPSQMRHKLYGVVDVASHLLKGWRQWSSNVMTTNIGGGGGGNKL